MMKHKFTAIAIALMVTLNLFAVTDAEYTATQIGKLNTNYATCPDFYRETWLNFQQGNAESVITARCGQLRTYAKMLWQKSMWGITKTDLKTMEAASEYLTEAYNNYRANRKNKALSNAVINAEEYAFALEMLKDTKAFGNELTTITTQMDAARQDLLTQVEVIKWVNNKKGELE